MIPEDTTNELEYIISHQK